jgi:hypothetical protein
MLRFLVGDKSIIFKVMVVLILLDDVVCELMYKPIHSTADETTPRRFQRGLHIRMVGLDRCVCVLPCVWDMSIIHDPYGELRKPRAFDVSLECLSTGDQGLQPVEALSCVFEDCLGGVRGLRQVHQRSQLSQSPGSSDNS